MEKRGTTPLNNYHGKPLLASSGPRGNICTYVTSTTLAKNSTGASS